MIEHYLPISIHAYYVKENEAGLRACEYILNNSTEPNVVESTMRNRLFYIDLLSSMMPVSFTKIEHEPYYEGWNNFNPSIFKSHDGNLYMIIRSSNYVINSNGHYIIHNNHNVVLTEAIFVQLNNDLEVVRSIRLQKPNYPEVRSNVEGLEDLRLFENDQGFIVSSTICNHQDTGHRRVMARSSILDDRIVNCHLLEPYHNWAEKNWMPICDGSGDKFVYHCNINGESVVRVHSNGSFSEIKRPSIPIAIHFRGGSQLVPFDDGFICIIHEVAYLWGKRVYTHRFVKFDKSYTICAFSKPFSIMEKHAIEFAAGIAINGNQVHVSFGLKDAQAWIASVDVENVRRSLTSLV